MNKSIGFVLINELHCLLTAKTVGITHFLLKSYKTTRTKEADTHLGICLFHAIEE